MNSDQAAPQGQASPTTKDVENFLEKSRQEHKKPKPERPSRSHKKNPADARYPATSRKIIVQYHTTILDEFGNEIDKVLEEEEVAEEELKSKFMAKKSVKKKADG